MIKESTRGVVRTNVNFLGSTGAIVSRSSMVGPSVVPEASTKSTPFKTNASALGSYGPMTRTKHMFSETPQYGYRDRAT